MSIPIIILGGGGHAKVLIDTLILRSENIIGFTDHKLTDETIKEVQYIGNDSIILKYPPNEVALVNGLGSVKDTEQRKQLFILFKNLGYTFASVVHPSAIIASDVKLSEGVQIMAGTIIQPGSCISENTIINTRASIDHDCIIGSHVHIAPGVTLSGGVYVNDEVHIGTGAVVIQNIKIGSRSLIGAGALVIREVPEGTSVVGVPAREVLKITIAE